MINGYAKNGRFNEGLKLFRAMCGGGEKPDSFCVSAVLPACAGLAAHKNGKEKALMDMYVKSGSIESALKIFDRMISWTVMILGYSLHGQGEAGVKLFKETMKGKGRVVLDRTMFAAALPCCKHCILG